MSSYLESTSFDIGRHVIYRERRAVVTWDYSRKPFKQVGKVSRDSAGLIAVKLWQGLGFKVLKHKDGIIPMKLHLDQRRRERDTERDRRKRERERCNNTM